MITKTAAPLLGMILLCSCQPHSSALSNNQPATAATASNKSDQGRESKNMEIKITSKAFTHGGAIPLKYTCDGADVSPPLEWEGVPANAKSISLICEDPDAPGKTWVHWVVYDLPATTTQLPEDIKHSEQIGSTGKQGTNDFHKVGYGGPCPPKGTHRYFFRVYALDTETSLDVGATKDQLLKVMEGHILAQGELMGKYTR